MSQLVMKITRPLSKTCLDHIWSSHPERLINVWVLSTGMSDHLPTIVTRKYKGVQQNKSEHTTITYRDIKNLLIKNSLLLHWKKRLGILRLFLMILMALLMPGTIFSKA